MKMISAEIVRSSAPEGVDTTVGGIQVGSVTPMHHSSSVCIALVGMESPLGGSDQPGRKVGVVKQSTIAGT
jgi:hypothetical protein